MGICSKMTSLSHPVLGLGERLKCSREGAQNIQHNTIIHTHREGDIAGQTAMYIKRWRLN